MSDQETNPVDCQPIERLNPSVKRKTRKIPTKEDIHKAVLLQEVGFKTKEIAKIEGVHRTTLWKYLKEFRVDTKQLKQYADGLRDEVLKACLDDLNLAKRVTNHFVHLNKNEFEKLSPTTMLALKRTNDIGIGIKVEKYQILSGLPTQFIAYADVIKARDQAKLTLDEVREIHKQRHSNVTDVIDITNNSVDSGLHNDI